MQCKKSRVVIGQNPVDLTSYLILPGYICSTKRAGVGSTLGSPDWTVRLNAYTISVVSTCSDHANS